MEYYSAIQKEGNLAFCNNIGVIRGYYVKWNKSNRERQIPYDVIYIWNLKKSNKWTNRKIEMDSYRELVVARGEGSGATGKIGGGDWCTS